MVGQVIREQVHVCRERERRRVVAELQLNLLRVPPFAEVAEPVAIRHKKRTRAREQEGGEEPRRAPMPWLSQRSRGERSILDMEF
jgi:hypothetical protein